MSLMFAAAEQESVQLVALHKPRGRTPGPEAFFEDRADEPTFL